MSYIVAAEAQFDSEQEDTVRPALSRLVEESRKEPGNLLYRVHHSVEDPTLLMFYEEFVDEDSFDSHCNSSHYLDFKRETDGLIQLLSARVYAMAE